MELPLLVRHFYTETDVRLHVVEEGAGDQAVVLLHGFPEFWYSWRNQFAPLASAGLHVLAPDMRGYNLSDKPPDVSDYAADHLVGDIAGFIRKYAGGQAHLVGHDWGGVVAWRLATLHPELIRKLVILNAPHPATYRRVLTTGIEQWFRSWYVGLFQLPWLAEATIRAGDYYLFTSALKRQPANHAAFTAEDIRRYKETWAQPGALTAGLNYYRAALRQPASLLDKPQQVRVPTLVIWGERDPYLSVRLLKNLPEYVADLRIERLANVSHWVQNDAPEQVNELLIDFLISKPV